MSSPLAALHSDNDNNGPRRIANDHHRPANAAPQPATPVALRHAFTRLAAGENAMLSRIGETVATRKAALRAMLSSDHTPAAMQYAATRFADDMIVGAFRAARARTPLPARSMIAPLAVAAVGAYGRRAMLPTERPEISILVLTGSGRAAPVIIEDSLNLLQCFAFDVDYAVMMFETLSVGAARIDLSLTGSRLLWGRTDLYAQLGGANDD